MSQFKDVLKLLTLVTLLLVSHAGLGAPGGNEHPVFQLVKWELTANPELGRESFIRMGHAILCNLGTQELPNRLKAKLNLHAFQSADHDSQIEMVNLLTDDELKTLIVIPAELKYLEVSEAEFNKLSDHRVFELENGGLEKFRALIQFKKYGMTYYRWPIHPLAKSEDSPVFKMIERLRGQAPKLKKGFLKFNFTSSRSLIVFHDSYDDSISLKISLPKGEGPFKQKAVSMKGWRAWTDHNRWLKAFSPDESNPHLVLLREPYGLALADSTLSIDDGLLARDLKDLLGGAFYYLPVFSVMTDTAGVEIATLNGSDDPYAFWTEHLIRPLAMAISELRARTGAEHTSPHSQNLMVELDSELKPTGRIVLRDFDFYIDDNIFYELNSLGLKSEGLTRSGFQFVGFALRNGFQTLPSWLDDKKFGQWIEQYFQVYRDHFSKVTEIPPETAFDSADIYKYSYWQYVPVLDRDYLTGAKANFHVIYFSTLSRFRDWYLNWLSGKEGAQPINPDLNSTPSQDLSAENKPSAKYQSTNTEPLPLEEFSTFITAKTTFDSLDSRLEIATSEAKSMSLGDRKNWVQRVGMESLAEAHQNSRDPKAIFESLLLVFEIEPLFVHEIAKRNGRNPMKVDESNPYFSKIKNLFNRAEELNSNIALIRSGSKEEVIKSLAVVEKVLIRPYTSNADAFAYRLKREQDSILRGELALALARFAKDDSTVKSFLENNKQLVPQEFVGRVEDVINGRETNCIGIVRQAS
ncbi:MAG: hypothetical protein KDD22_03745 [Bdellovibrionales bacterium]|nr:hypothetical protein [Bdellovibrionales bacterium]